jgi:hypothetical protein|nr:MAG TPA: hypothetical protein [Caudoviricetes sp.]
MNNKKILGQEKISLLKPFPFNDGERYLLKLVGDKYVVAYWENGQFTSDYNDEYIEEEIESYVSLKDLWLYEK